MDYIVEIYRPGSCNRDACVKTFTTASPFLTIRVGDLINTSTWQLQWPVLRVVNVEHFISESSQGIDPSGRITHRIVLYTESAPDTDETRCKSAMHAG
jgi:hypothetical protein